MRILITVGLSLCLLVVGGILIAQQANKPQPETAASSTAAAQPADPLSFTVAGIDGKDVDLAVYRGKVVMIVNVASRCGYTPQYKQLQALYEKYGKQGLAILAFPANNFGGQEPGTNEEIATFCTGTFGVTFDLFGKLSAAGDDIAPLYRHLTDKQRYPQTGGPIAWNFTKFVLGRDGRVISRFDPKVTPNSPEVVKVIETALAVPAPAAAVKAITWHHTLPEAITAAKADKKLILIDFHAAWCGWCTRLDEDTLSKPEVQARLRDFTLLKIDTDQYPDIAKQFEVEGLPTTMILDTGSKVIRSKAGYMTPSQYLQFLAQENK